MNEESSGRLWRANIKKYKEYLESLRPHLSKKAQSFFINFHLHDLHDGKLLSFSTGDLLGRNNYPYSNYTEIKILNHINTHIYLLRYTKVSKCSLDFPSDEPVYHSEGEYIYSDWWYDELSMGKKGIFRHEILFASGATALIDFKHFTFKKVPFKG